MKIIATHLFNDYSGSPKVLMQLVKGWIKNDLTVELHTCGDRDGFLSEIEGVNYCLFNYKLAANPFKRLLNLMRSQVTLFIQILKNSTKKDIVYINTVLPFGAALAGKIKGCRVVYHIHETSVKPAVLKSFLFGMVKWCATDVIYVSHYLAQNEPIHNKNIHILHNAIEIDFLLRAKKSREKDNPLQNILMVCSLKEYKGVNEFLQIAQRMPNHAFRLVLNASQDEIISYFMEKNLSKNIRLYSVQSDVHPFYKWADVVLNLSNIDTWVETFGLTIIEGMSYGNPAIVPTVGGVTEVVSEEKNGALINSSNINGIVNRLLTWSTNNQNFNRLRKEAKATVDQFNEDIFIQNNIKILTTNN